jgi:hypothetical protein
VVPTSSSLGFDAKSTLHAVHGTASQLTGFVEATLENGGIALEPPPAMHVEFPVERLTSGNALQDKETWKLIGSARNPTIVADLRELTPGSGATYHAAGEITMSGRKKNYAGDLTIVVERDRMVVDGTLVVDIRDFGLTPPRLLMVTVQPEVSVKLHLVAILDHGAT